MRLICPNCQAQYEIAQNAVPQDGRDVQCSSCNHVWFHLPAAAETPAPPPQHSLSDDVRTILREEAAREAMVRAAEARQPDPAREAPGAAAPVAPPAGPRNHPVPALAVDTRARRGFWLGFLLVLLTALILFGIYADAPALSRQVPQTAEALTSYVETVDSARLWLDEAAHRITTAIRTAR